MSKDLVVKTNWLNQAIQKLTLIEIRLIQLAIVDARESGRGLSPDKPLTITAKRYADAFVVQAKNAYANIKQAEDTLFKRQFTFIDKDGKSVKSRWVQDVKYLDDRGEIELCFTRSVVAGIARIDGVVDFFTKYLLNNTVQFNSVYSVRLYELLTQWKNADQNRMPVFDLGLFRQQLGIKTTQYKAVKDFKKRVLDYAIKEINTYSDLYVSYEQHKQGRTIVGFKFRIEVKPAKTRQATIIDGQAKTIKPVPAPLQELTPAERDVVDKAKAYADNQGVGDTHKQNIINKALRDYREDQEAKQAQEAAERVEKAQRAQKQQETLSYGVELYQRLLAADTAVQAQFCQDNMRGFSLFERLKCEQQDYIGLIRSIQYRFEAADSLHLLNLSALTNA